MKLPSLQSLWDEILVVLRRFPLQVVITIIAVIACIVKIEKPEISALDRLLAACNFALTLLLAADLFSESHNLKPSKKNALRIIVLLICGLLYLVLDPVLYEADMLRIVLLAFAFHLLVSFAPFVSSGTVNGFWTYNSKLFLHIITAGLFSFVLTIGFYIAFASTNALFDLNLSGDIYGYIASVTMVGFMTIFFLSGVPKDFKILNEKEQAYPKLLKVFTQYVLIPLLSIYLLILLVYEAKILFTWQLPKGYVSMLIMGYAVAGILSLLLIYPIRNKEGNSWMGIFFRFFYVMMIPLVLLLLLAVWKRVYVYGITEARYLLILLALWLTIITIYNLFSKKYNIKLIPMSLCILALLSTYGPQSGFSISKYSQTLRLQTMLNRNDAFSRKEKPEIIKYLVKYHGIMALQSFTNRDLKPLKEKFEMEMADSSRKYAILNKQIDTALAILKVEKHAESSDLKRDVIVKSGTQVFVKGYDYLIPFSTYGRNESLIGNLRVKITRPTAFKVSISVNKEIKLIDIAPIYAKIDAAYKQGRLKLIGQDLQLYQLPESGIDIPFENKYVEGVFRVTELQLSGDNDRPTFFSGSFLLRLKTTK